MSNLKMKGKTGWKRSRRGRIVIAITMLIPATIILYIIVTLRLTASTMNDSKQIILEQSHNSVERYTKHIEQVARSMVLSVYDTLQDTERAKDIKIHAGCFEHPGSGVEMLQSMQEVYIILIILNSGGTGRFSL